MPIFNIQFEFEYNIIGRQLHFDNFHRRKFNEIEFSEKKIYEIIFQNKIIMLNLFALHLIL